MSGASTTSKGAGGIGAIFLGIGIMKFLSGGSWVVWLLLGFLFGGFGFLARKNKEGAHGE